MDVDILLHMNERRIGYIVIEAFKNLFGDALPFRVLGVIGFVHLVLVVFVEDIGVKDQDGKGNEIGLI